MGYSLAPQQWTLAPGATIGLTYSHNNDEWVGASVMYGAPFQNGHPMIAISARPCQILWNRPNATYSAGITNQNNFTVTFLAHLGWIDL